MGWGGEEKHQGLECDGLLDGGLRAVGVKECKLTFRLQPLWAVSLAPSPSFVNVAFAAEFWISGFAVINHLGLFSSLTAGDKF